MALTQITDEPRLLVVRHARRKRHFYDVILSWIEEHFPAWRPLLDVWDLPDETARDFPRRPDIVAWRALWTGVRRWTRRDRQPLRLLLNELPPGVDYRLHVPWLQDPVQAWSAAAYERCQRIAAACDRRGIPIVNRVDRLTSAAKSTAAASIAAAGIRTPRMQVIHDAAEFRETLLGLDLPLFVRENWGHCGRMWRADTPRQVRKLPIDRLVRPVAVEIVDASDRRDGLFRKYRYVAAGDVGVSHHVQVSREWITRGDHRIISEETRDEELAYIGSADPHHAELQRARRALGLDLVAFDYGHTPDGQLVIWEANPFPHLHFSRRKLAYRNAAMHRTMLAIFRLYLHAAGLPIPEPVEAGLEYPALPAGLPLRAAA